MTIHEPFTFFVKPLIEQSRTLPIHEAIHAIHVFDVSADRAITNAFTGNHAGAIHENHRVYRHGVSDGWALQLRLTSEAGWSA